MKVVNLLLFSFALLPLGCLAQIDTLSQETEATAPEFPGGAIALQDYINKHLTYPKRARQKQIEGKVYIQFAVEPDGNLNSFQISKSLSKECDEEVIRLMKKSPRWIPATENGVPVQNWMIVPIEFVLKKDN